MTKVRINFIIEQRALELLDSVAKFSKQKRSTLLNNLIIQKLQDPIKALKEEKRQLIIRANELADKIKYLENEV
jgi:hypothetical protein